jgi:hypothetical protein
LLINAIKYKNSYFLVIRTTGQDLGYNDTVQMEWNQIIELTEPKNGKNVITLVSEFDFKGYSTLEDSQKMAMKLLNLIP